MLPGSAAIAPGCLGPVADPELVDDVAHMGLDGPDGDRERGGDLAVAEVLGQQAEDVALTLAELLEGRRFTRPGRQRPP